MRIRKGPVILPYSGEASSYKISDYPCVIYHNTGAVHVLDEVTGSRRIFNNGQCSFSESVVVTGVGSPAYATSVNTGAIYMPLSLPLNPLHISSKIVITIGLSYTISSADTSIGVGSYTPVAACSSSQSAIAGDFVFSSTGPSGTYPHGAWGSADGFQNAPAAVPGTPEYTAAQNTVYCGVTISRPVGQNLEARLYDANAALVWSSTVANTTVGDIQPAQFWKGGGGTAIYQQIVYEFSSEPSSLEVGRAIVWHTLTPQHNIKAPWPGWKHRT